MPVSITTINASDQITNSRADLNNNFDNLNSGKLDSTMLSTDDTFASASDSKIPSQLAVKNYVDSGGQQNASETVRGLVEEATDAEVTAGTATGGTGAKLFITPTKLATRLSSIPTATTPYLLALSTNDSFSTPAMGSNATGSVIYIQTQNNGNLHRFEKDSATGMFVETHTVDTTVSWAGAGSDTMALVQVGNYIYVFGNDNTNIACYRYLAADLTGEQVMTVPTVAATSAVGAWTDGTYVYVVGGSDTTSRKWSISGTTMSAVSTATVDANIYMNPDAGSTWDGTNAYVASRSGITLSIRKLTTIDGTTYTTTTKKLPLLSDSISGTILVPINSTSMFVGFAYAVYNATAKIATYVMLIPITRP